MYLQENIKNLRKYKSMNQEKLAELVGVKRSSIGAYEEGRAEPPIGTLNKMAKVFGITLDDLINRQLLTRTEKVLFKDGEL